MPLAVLYTRVYILYTSPAFTYMFLGSLLIQSRYDLCSGIKEMYRPQSFLRVYFPTGKKLDNMAGAPATLY